MEKDFDIWNEKKKTIDLKINTIYFKEGEIWWISLSQNIGYEMNGKVADLF